MLAAQNIHPLTSVHPADDQRRVAMLHRYHVLDLPFGDDFHFLTRLAAHTCGTPYAWLTLVDADTVHVKSAIGLPLTSQVREQSYCVLGLSSQSITEIEDLRADGRTAFLPLTSGEPRLRRYSAAPLVSADGQTLGALCVMDTQTGRLTAEQRELLHGLARQAMALIEARSQERALAAARANLEELSTTDALTGLHNRRSLLGKLKFEVARTRRFRTPLSAVMIDLDHFRDVNQRHGDTAGDLVLAAVAKLVQDNVRVIDVAGRYGGEEICVVLPNTPHDGALKLAENLRLKIAAHLHREAGRLAPVTASIGVSSFNHMDISDGDALLEHAEQALQRAKDEGRNRVAG